MFVPARSPYKRSSRTETVFSLSSPKSIRLFQISLGQILWIQRSVALAMSCVPEIAKENLDLKLTAQDNIACPSCPLPTTRHASIVCIWCATVCNMTDLCRCVAQCDTVSPAYGPSPSLKKLTFSPELHCSCFIVLVSMQSYLKCARAADPSK
jgi:hypothetical protein